MASAWRSLRRHFGIAAPRMAVRTHLPWWGRGAIALSLAAVLAGMWWWGFDVGQILGGFNRKEIEPRLASLEADATRYRAEATEIRAHSALLESELAMTRGKQDALTKQATELTAENAQLKEELAFLQKLVSDSSKSVGLAVQRVDVEPDGNNAWRFSILVVRGGSPKDEFVGKMVIRATLAPSPPAEEPVPAIQIPDDDPETGPALRLKFKYYQRVEGRFRVPPGSRVTAVEVRGYESGHAAPRVTRTVSLG
jgi:hypothetical protein